jgi:hypothetical protein
MDVSESEVFVSFLFPALNELPAGQLSEGGEVKVAIVGVAQIEQRCDCKFDRSFRDSFLRKNTPHVW